MTNIESHTTADMVTVPSESTDYWGVDLLG